MKLVFVRDSQKFFNEYARKYGLLKQKDKNLEGSDVREGLTAIISVKYLSHYYNLKDRQNQN